MCARVRIYYKNHEYIEESVKGEDCGFKFNNNIFKQYLSYTKIFTDTSEYVYNNISIDLHIILN